MIKGGEDLEAPDDRITPSLKAVTEWEAFDVP